MRTIEKLDETEQNLVRKWKVTVLACYGTVLAAMVAIMILSQAASNWVAAAAQTEMRDQTRPAAEQTLLTMNKK